MDNKREETIKTDQRLIKTKWNYIMKNPIILFDKYRII